MAEKKQMIEEYVKNHTEKEIIARIARDLGLISQEAHSALNDQNMYLLAAKVVDMGYILEIVRALDKKMNGPKSKVL